jgi:hypothetical protein
VAAAAFVYLAALQIRAVQIVDNTYAMDEDEHAVFGWIKGNVEGDETVVTSSLITTLLLDNLTPASGYQIGGYNPVAYDSELIDRYLRMEAAYGYGEEVTFDRLDPGHGFPFDTDVPASERDRDIEYHVAYYTFYWQVTTRERLDERIPAWREQFREVAREQNVLSAYPADYLYCGPRERFWPTIDPAPGTFVREATRSGDVVLYALTDADDPEGARFRGC